MGGGIEPSEEETLKDLRESREKQTAEIVRLRAELKQSKRDEDTIARFMAKVLKSK